MSLGPKTKKCSYWQSAHQCEVPAFLSVIVMAICTKYWIDLENLTRPVIGPSPTQTLEQIPKAPHLAPWHRGVAALHRAPPRWTTLPPYLYGRVCTRCISMFLFIFLLSLKNRSQVTRTVLKAASEGHGIRFWSADFYCNVIVSCSLTKQTTHICKK